MAVPCEIPEYQMFKDLAGPVATIVASLVAVVASIVAVGVTAYILLDIKRGSLKSKKT